MTSTTSPRSVGTLCTTNRDRGGVRPHGHGFVASGEETVLTVDVPAEAERAIRQDERRSIARLAQAHVDDGDLLALQRFIAKHGDKAAQRGLALFVGYLASFTVEDDETRAA